MTRRRRKPRPTLQERIAAREAARYPDLDPMASIQDAFEYRERLARDHRHCSCSPPYCCAPDCPGRGDEPKDHP